MKVFFNDFAIKDWGDEIFVKVNFMILCHYEDSYYIHKF